MFNFFRITRSKPSLKMSGQNFLGNHPRGLIRELQFKLIFNFFLLISDYLTDNIVEMQNAIGHKIFLSRYFAFVPAANWGIEFKERSSCRKQIYFQTFKWMLNRLIILEYMFILCLSLLGILDFRESLVVLWLVDVCPYVYV